MDPLYFMQTEDQFEALLMMKISAEVLKRRIERDEQLAVLIANAVWQAVK